MQKLVDEQNKNMYMLTLRIWVEVRPLPKNYFN